MISETEMIASSYRALWLEVFFVAWHNSQAYSDTLSGFFEMVDPDLDEEGNEDELRLEFHTTAMYEMAMSLWAIAGGNDKVTTAADLLFEQPLD